VLPRPWPAFGTISGLSASLNTWRLQELGIGNDVHLIPFDLTELLNIQRCIESIEPDELYNLAAQSFVKMSFEQPMITADINAIGALRILEVIRTIHLKTKIYQASTSEMYGGIKEFCQDECSMFYPRSPYAAAKLFAYWIMINYREAYNIFTVNGILFNHESALRGMEFVTRKITLGLAKIKFGQQKVLELGNMDAKRDWGYAGDFVEGMWLMLQQDKPDDYVLATGESHTVKEFVDIAAEKVGFDLAWEGEGPNAKGLDRRTGKVIVQVNPDFYRPSEVNFLLGNSQKAKEKLGWSPKVSFEKLVELMVEADLNRISDKRLVF
ncbi:MAG: GDP-mannose 4,6-dehydratase, partial [Deltaproteobacteria bacterium]|nr:GDP-mannose 4,6-dehydratase [Deltaproteobacteria bacterium]